MEDLSLHVLDIAENSVRADARTIFITVARDARKDLLTITVADDGRGMDEATKQRVRDPFFSTKDKKTGLGIPFLAMAAEQAGGAVMIESSRGKGTTVTATFSLSSIDRPALGNMADTVVTLIAGHPDRNVVYEVRDNDDVFRIDTAEIRADLDGVPITAPPAIEAIRNMLAGRAQW
jgi:anti-sigma regulatory factor (Ser/Thr protein kinase)